MTYQFTIFGRLANLNDYLKAERVAIRTPSGRFTTKGNNLKHNTQKGIVGAIRRDLGGLHINRPIKLHYKFYEPNKKRDMDNVWAFASKCTQDSLVVAGVLDNDGWEQITGISAEFFVDKDNPRIEVFLIED